MKSSESSVYGERSAENLGLAVFKNDKLVGELTSVETACYSIITNQLSGFLITIENPQGNEDYLDLSLYLNHAPIQKVDIINETPYITIDCKFEGKVYSANNNSRFLDEEFLREISDTASRHMEIQMYNYLYKTAKEYRSDINGFGKYARSKFLTIQDYEDYNWPDNYENAFFKVNCDVTIKSSFLITET